MVRTLFGCLVLSLLALGSAACARSEPDTIAVIGDFSGTSQAIGFSIRDGARFALDHVTTQFNLNLRLVEYDDAAVPKLAEKVAFNVAADPRVLAVIGHSQSGTTARAERVYGRFNLPLMMPVATNPDIVVDDRTYGRWQNAFRLVPTDDNQAQHIADFARYNVKARRAAIVHDNTRYGRTLARSLARSFVQKSIDTAPLFEVPLVQRGAVPVQRPDSYYGRAARLALEHDVDVVVFAGYYAECAEIIRNLRSAGFSRPIILTDGCFQTELKAHIGPEAGPLYLGFVAPDWSTLSGTAALRRYVQRNGVARDLSYEPFAYDAVMLIASAVAELKRRGETITRPGIARVLRDTRVPYDGMAGSYVFDGGDNLRARNYLFRAQLVDGRYTFVPQDVQ